MSRRAITLARCQRTGAPLRDEDAEMTGKNCELYFRAIHDMAFDNGLPGAPHGGHTIRRCATIELRDFVGYRLPIYGSETAMDGHAITSQPDASIMIERGSLSLISQHAGRCA